MESSCSGHSLTLLFNLLAPMQTPHRFAISSGDIGLILEGHKTLHFVRLPAGQALEAGESIDMYCHLPGGTYYSIPVTITEASPERSNGPLGRLDEWRAGHISGKPKKPFSTEVSEQRMNRIRPQLNKRIARQFLELPPLPPEVFANDLAPHDTLHPIHRISFTLKQTPDDAYPLGLLYRRFKTAYEQQAPRVTTSHYYLFNNHGQDGVFFAPTDDPSDLRAMRYRERHERPVELDKILARMRHPYELISQMNRVMNESRPFTMHGPDPDGLNKALCGLPTIPCSRDTGSLAVMEAIRRIALRRPLPEPPPGTHGLTAVLNATGRGTAISSHLHDFQVPVEIDTRQAQATTFHSHAITPAIAHLHGFANAGDMRHALGIRGNEQCDIVSYPFRLARAEALPLDRDRAGKSIVKQQHAARLAIKGTEEGKRAARFLDTLPAQERWERLASITPIDEHTPEMAAVSDIEWNKKGTRQLPNDERAARKHARPGSHPNGKKKKDTITLTSFETLGSALKKKEQRERPYIRLHPAHPTAPDAPISQNTELSPAITTADPDIDARFRVREGVDEHGVPVATAPVITGHKTLEGPAHEEHIERARAAKKPRGKHPSRRDRLRHERRETAATLKQLEQAADITGSAYAEAPQGLRWTDYLIEETGPDTKRQR